METNLPPLGNPLSPPCILEPQKGVPASSCMFTMTISEDEIESQCILHVNSQPLSSLIGNVLGNHLGVSSLNKANIKFPRKHVDSQVSPNTYSTGVSTSGARNLYFPPKLPGHSHFSMGFHPILQIILHGRSRSKEGKKFAYKPHSQSVMFLHSDRARPALLIPVNSPSYTHASRSAPRRLFMDCGIE